MSKPVFIGELSGPKARIPKVAFLSPKGRESGSAGNTRITVTDFLWSADVCLPEANTLEFKET